MNWLSLREDGRGILSSSPQPKQWTEEKDALLGKHPDREIARRLGRSVNSVEHRRTRLAIRLTDRAPRPWTPQEDALLGTLSDRLVAQKLGRTMKAVQSRRLSKGILRSHPQRG